MGSVHLDADDLKPGMAVGPYDLLAQVGAGGMARVWAARVRTSGQVVALKMMLTELVDDTSFVQMFADEARIASRVRHPNVCQTYDLGRHGRTPYLAMEWIDGPSFMSILRPGAEDSPLRRPIATRLAARMVAETCAGLHAAHDLIGDDGGPLGVVHRDVSPHNLLVTSTGQIKVTDFGVAKARGKTQMTVAGQLKGKLSYMAPEQLMSGGVDRRTDVFALGITLYEITTGRRPFVGEHDPQVMAAIVMGRFDPPSAVVPGYPRDLEAIIMRAMSGEPALRFASAEEMRAALEKVRRDERAANYTGGRGGTRT